MEVEASARPAIFGSGYRWSTLPDAILRMIIEKLELSGDRRSVVSVCKGWRIQLPPNDLPWLAPTPTRLRHARTGRLVLIDFNFYEPYNPRPYTRSIVLAVPSRHFVGYPTIQDSKFGWLLVSVPHYKSRLFSPIAYYSQFVYHPFSDVSLDLPDLYSKGLDMATFSGSDPTSEDCVFFVLVQKKYPDTTIEIHIWTQDQEAWKKHEFETGQYWGFDKNVAYVDEIFYCLSMPHMGSFNPSSGEWRDIALPSQICDVDLCFINVRLFELNGEILLLMFNSPYTITEKVAERNHVLFKFDPFEDAWIKRDGFLNDRVLFISYTNPSCYSILAKGQAEKMGNKVYTNYSSYSDDDGDMLLRQFYGLSWLAP